MEPLVSLKRQMETDPMMCIICQENKPEKILCGSIQGHHKLQECAQARYKLRDISNRAAIDRIEISLFGCGGDGNHVEGEWYWHKSCYGIFTSKTHINRLEKKTLTALSPESQNSQSSPVRLRSEVQPICWDTCMFCQVSTTEKLSSISTFKMSQNIVEASRFDQRLNIRLSGISDLIAAEGKYHGNCYKSFVRRTSKTEEKINNMVTDIAVQWLVDELKISATNGHILDLVEVWNRYIDLAETAGVCVPQSFISRRATFREKLEPWISDIYECIPLRNQPVENRTILLVPRQFGHIPITQLATEDQEDFAIPRYDSQESGFLEMVHLALKLRSDILQAPEYKGFQISDDEAIACVPDSLFMFLRLMIGGQSLLDYEADEREEKVMTEKESKVQNVVLSIAQDLVYSVSKRWTPKHVGLGSTLHQSTRSKDLVQLFHNAGHIISYDNILQVDTALAEKTLASMDEATGSVVPPNLVHNTFVHFTCDNIDINDSSLNGKDSFHATQVASWQRGPASDMGLNSLHPTTNKTTLEVPAVLEELIPAGISFNDGRTEPTLTQNTEKEWFVASAEDNYGIRKAMATDMAFFILRQKETDARTGWTQFNQEQTDVDPPVTTVGYIPIVQAPAHELDTLNTVVVRCRHVANTLGQKHVVLTVDEALYCKLMELKWARDEYQDFLIVRLGGLHILMNFMKIIGTHVQSSGLLDAWIESDIIGPKAAEQVLNGKAYARGIRMHKLTIQALWRILLPQLLLYVDNTQLKMAIINHVTTGDTEGLLSLLQSEEFNKILEVFVASNNKVNFSFWWGYMEMVQTLLLFIRAQREGNWELHLYAFKRMLPLFFRYNHTNYARWGTVYINEMHQLPNEVQKEFRAGNFVVKRSLQKFNQVDPDQSQEWLNAVGKKGGGIVGITKTSSALSRWALSYNLRSHISMETRELYNLTRDSDEGLVHNESTNGRRKVDNQEECRLFETFVSLNVFVADAPDVLQNIFTKDLATEEITDDLLQAVAKGQDQLNKFVEDRLLPSENSEVAFHDTLRRNKTLTFSSLYEAHVKSLANGKDKVFKADRSVLQRLVIAYQSGRSISLDEILHHELLPVPISLAEMNGKLRSGSKAVLSDVLTMETHCPTSLPQQNQGVANALIIDGQALVVAIGKPKEASTFQDLAQIFINSVTRAGMSFCRIDIVFDRYYDNSVKSATRQKRAKGAKPVRRPIENGTVPLPQDWGSFLAMSENKADLERFLSEETMKQGHGTKTIVAAGGFVDEEQVEATSPDVDTDKLRARHEEADTRVILHCVKIEADSIVVQARDTDILVLLLAHFSKMSCTKLWLKAGTAKRRKYVPVHSIVENMQFTQPAIERILAFHALTGCDVTSYFGGHSKKTAWKVFQDHNELLENLGKGELTEETIKKAEQFVCRLYKLSNVDNVDKARKTMFVKCCAPESLPPTSDALSFHIKRSHYQAAVWRQAHINYPDLPTPQSSGWKDEEGKIVPILMSLPPVPESCISLISCGCTTECKTLRCKCRKARMVCTDYCKCKQINCCNDNRE